MSTLPLLRRLRAPRCRACVRYKSTSATDLPPPSEWREVFDPHSPAVRDRISVANPKTARTLAEAFLTKKSLVAGARKTVIESFPGPGALSRALLQLDAGIVERLIILEDWEPYLKYLRPLEKADPRVRVVPKSGYAWETYDYLQDEGYLDHLEKVPFEYGMHPQLHFISHIPQNTMGEQLIAQLFRNIPQRTWLFKYGCVPMSFVMGEWIWERVAAEPSTKARCKVSVIAEATAMVHTAVAPTVLQPYNEHFHPAKGHSESKRPESRRIGYPLVAANVLPYSDQVIELGLLDKWDYVLRKLFVLKAKPLKNAISGLAFGADSLLRVLASEDKPPRERVDINLPIRSLSLRDWQLIVKAFDEWPFAPESLVISDAFGPIEKR